MRVTPPLASRPSLRHENIVRDIGGTILFVIAVFVLSELVAPRFIVDGPSMEPTFYTDHRLVVSRLSYLLSVVERGDIAVFIPPDAHTNDAPLVKRVIGLPGDVIELREQQVYVNGEQLDEPYINEPCAPVMCADGIWTLGPNQFFLMGDNRNHSRDSRSFGPVPRNRLLGQALIRYYPIDQIGIIDKLYFPTTP